MADYGEMMDSGARSARRTILIPKCSNEEEDDEVMRDGDFFLFIISKVLTKNNQRRREKTHVEQRVAVFSYLRNRRSDPENEGENEVSESRQDDERGELLQNTNTPIYTIVEHTLTLTPETNNKTRTNNVLFSILVYCPS